jgi:hypothetical protein
MRFEIDPITGRDPTAARWDAERIAKEANHGTA